MTIFDTRGGVLTPTDPRKAANKQSLGYNLGTVCPGETIGNSKTEFYRILCTSKSEAAVNNKTAL